MAMSIKQIDKLRIKFDFRDDNTEKYKDFCKRHRREKGCLSCIKIEYLLLAMRDNTEMKPKNRRKILRLARRCNDVLYRDYILYRIGEHTSIDVSQYREYPSFLQELSGGGQQHAATWHDVEIRFSNDVDRARFEANEPVSSYSFYGADRYHRQVANRIVCIERMLQRMLVPAKSRYFYLRVSRKICEKSEELQVLLRENFAESAHLQQVADDSRTMADFFAYLDAFENCREIEPSPIVSFQPPAMFSTLTDDIERFKKERSFEKNKLKRRIKSMLRDVFSRDTLPVPFPPVFYDIANDYIQYPQVKGGIAGIGDLLGKLNVFGRK